MAWYIPTPSRILPGGPLRSAVQKHMGPPLFERGQRCGYTPLTTGRRCHHPLGCYSDHVFVCAQGPGMRRRNRMRDTWIHLCRRAGWHTDAEQLVYIASGETKRADLVTLAPEGQRLACDVMVTAAPAPWQPHGPHLDVSAAAKATRYNCAAGGFTHDRAQFFPVIHDAHNHWISPHALDQASSPPDHRPGAPAGAGGTHCLGRPLPASHGRDCILHPPRGSHPCLENARGLWPCAVDVGGTR